MSTRWVVRALLVACAAAITGAGWTTGAAAAATPAQIDRPGTALVGWVSADGPVRGAKVRVTGARGRVVGIGTSNAEGMWAVRVRGALPKQFSVLATGGRDNHGRVRDTLVADLVGWTPGETITVNLATTLHDLYRDEHPGVGIAAAERIVARSLGLPPDTDLSTDTRFPTSWYSDDRFAEIALARGGGLGEYASTLVDEAHDGEVTYFRETPAELADAADTGDPDEPAPGTWGTGASSRANVDIGVAGKWIAGQLLEHVTGKEGVAAGFEKFLDFVGLTRGPEAEILAKLEEISTKLDGIQQQIQQLSRDLADVNRRLATAAYVAQVQPVTELEAYTRQQFAAMEAMVDARSPTAFEAARENFVVGMDDPLLGPDLFRTGLDAMDRAMSGSAGIAGIDGAMSLWTQRVSLDRRFWTRAAQLDLFAAWRRWSALQGQLLAVNKTYQRITGNTWPVKRWEDKWGDIHAPAYRNWLEAGGLTGVRLLDARTFYDAGTGRIWWMRIADRAASWEPWWRFRLDPDNGGGPVPTVADEEYGAQLHEVLDQVDLNDTAVTWPKRQWFVPGQSGVPPTAFDDLSNGTGAYPSWSAKWPTRQEAFATQGGPRWLFDPTRDFWTEVHDGGPVKGNTVYLAQTVRLATGERKVACAATSGENPLAPPSCKTSYNQKYLASTYPFAHALLTPYHANAFLFTPKLP